MEREEREETFETHAKLSNFPKLVHGESRVSEQIARISRSDSPRGIESATLPPFPAFD
jgi:hypothetical protein